MTNILKYGTISAIAIILIYLFYPKSGIKGIDVSHHNNYNISDYIQNNEVDYLIAKATEGTTFKDKKFKLHKKIAKSHNIHFGAYHFLNFDSPAREQFNNYKSIVKKSDIDFKPILDVELYGNKEYPSKSKLQRLVREFGELCYREYGCYPIIYCNEAFKITYFLTGFSNYPFWICNYITNNINSCDMQQYKIDTVHNIDLNKIYSQDRLFIK